MWARLAKTEFCFSSGLAMLSLPAPPDNVWGTFSLLSNVHLGVSPGVDRLIVRYHVHIIPKLNLHLRIIVLFKTMAFF